MAISDGLIGREIGEGRYRIVALVGEGSMGHVYRAHDRHLEIDVVLKFPASADSSLEGPDFLERFGREVRSLVRLSHPHIVKVIDVGALDGHPYVVMQYLDGGSLKERLESGADGSARPMPPESLSDWLLEVAKALDFIHGQDYLHRDVKPANIMFDRHGNAFLGDFGIIKALSNEGDDRKASSLTAPGYLLGTPNYVAPEIVMGKRGDGRVDQYALAMTVHEVLTGENFMLGPTPSATVVNQTKLVPPPLVSIVPRVPTRLSDAILRGLSKEPNDRFPDCVTMAREVLAELLPGGSQGSGVYAAAPSGAATPRSWTSRTLTDTEIPVLYGPDSEPEADAAAHTVLTERPDTESGLEAHAEARPKPSTGRRLLLGGALALALAGLFALGRGLWFGSSKPDDRPPSKGSGTAQAREPRSDGPPSIAGAGAALVPVEVNIAYGTEKREWLEQARGEYMKTPGAAGKTINLLPMGSLEGAQAVLEGPKPTPIHVWSPASAAYRDVFESEWRIRHGGTPIFRAENLALTPMVFVMWKERYTEFIKKYPRVTFQNLAEAMHEPGGWATIANRPDWGLFKFGHTDPNKSNSGLLTLVLMAYEFTGKQRDLTLDDIVRTDFQSWLRKFAHGITRHGGTLTHSTGTMMKEMVLRGPSQYDGLVIYENLAIESMRAAEEHWGEIFVAYPEPNLWNEHPYYILDVPWSDEGTRAAARHFLEFLMSEPIQRRALSHGFRPGNPAVPVRSADSPLVRNESHGIRLQVPNMGEPPKADVVNNLLSSFQRVER